MQISDIEASLSHGRLITGKRLLTLKICLAAPFLLPLVTILIIITVMTGNMDWSKDMVYALIFGNLLCLLALSVFLYAIISSTRLNKKIALWVEGAIKAKAFAKRLDVISLEFKPYQIQVDFKIDAKKYNRVSTPGGFIKGYHKIFAKYAGKQINILYSPKYDQVLILKNKN